jgi:hypothetical protein
VQEKKKGNGVDVEQVIAKLSLQKLLLSQKTFPNQIICMTITMTTTSEFLVGHGVIETSTLRGIMFP